ncbi:Maf family protein [Krasilnikoviella flava]|uniref:Nucleoside triphosphate pyrophosphatase n=1 Tax=Krasilnikoviella flava TaxID=526729 RepID=A0A1T5JNC5_9MICO|nr:nucleoside triphosphate pyrophosphatase [Krasilnikoviella flava]SKC52901.1 septum formation protein [Krasilnikoviella flava]
MPDTPDAPDAPVNDAVRLVLASQSPARLATLAAAGVTPRVVVSDVDEPAVLDAARAGVGGDLDPADAVLVLARAKAEDVSGRVEGEESALVLGCDSMLELPGGRGEVVGKPSDAAEARRRWRSMRGRAAVLHTGHWLVDLRDPEDGGTGGTLGASSATTVHFADVDDAEIDAYVATGEPLHVAGAFTIDGLGGPYVDRIEGDHHGVVGLSLPLLRELLGELGVPWRSLRSAG